MDYSHLKANERPKDDRDLMLGAGAAPVPVTTAFLPDYSWLKRNFQGQTTFCGEHAGAHLKAILDWNSRPDGVAYQPRFTPRYGAIKLKDPKSPVCDGFASNAGTDMRSIFKWLQKVGAADYEPLENNVLLPTGQYLAPLAVTPSIDANAATSTIDNYAFGATDFNSLCHDIDEKKAVLLLIKCDEGFWGTSTPTFTTAKYGHFVVATGHDLNRIRVLDSADPDDSFAVKFIDKKYITSKFIIESGTAIDAVQAQAIKSAIVSDAAVVVKIVSQDQQMSVATKKSILQQLAEFLLSLLPQKVGSASSTPMNIYNGWISKTNWSLVATFVVVIGNSIVPLLPVSVQDTVASLLLILAGYFHISGVKKAAIASANATAGTAAGASPRPVSGQ